MLKSILRIIIALIFIASGFVKAVDAVGFSFKLEEYFSPAVFNMPFLEKAALPVSIFVVALELLLGFMLLLKIRLKFALTALIALCVFFGFLTFYSAYFNVVTDCGCFGDAVKFTPWQSFAKDMILLAGLLVLWFLYRDKFQLLQQKKQSKYIALTVFVVIMGLIILRGILHEPLIDFRDYKIGTDLNAEKVKIAQNPSEYKTYYSLKNEKTGEILVVNQDDYVNEKKYWEEGSPWKIESDKNESKIVKQGYASEIAKFKPESADGTDLTEEILKAPKALLLFSYDPINADSGIIARTEAKLRSQKGAFVLGISTNPNTFKTIRNATMDGTAIKTIARSNPFVLMMENGKITDKISAEDYLKL
ncbi:BT_3928 family protein [Chryseobacterium sp.]|uniref:BT_3928 family protein n=1 Tax=Chryseobacterium sp. TaxID=1871047 RepID=UPI0011CB14EF|nr:BT_3928 family protein [Chryseobacterium sp.]TXF77610.1 DoxX family protein [Chryseobacterium sp.]